MYKFEWCYKEIKSQKEFDEFVENMLKKDNPYTKYPLAYEPMARVVHKRDDTNDCVIAKIQVPTYEWVDMTPDEEVQDPWIEVYKSEDGKTYDAENLNFSSVALDIITYENAKELLLKYAKDYCY